MNIKQVKLPYEASGNGATGGIFRLIMDAQPLGTGSLSVAVTINGELAFEGAATAEAGGKVNVNFHTHLMTQGKNELNVVLGMDGASGSVFHVLEVHDSPGLRAEVRRALDTHRVPVVFLGDCDAQMYASARESISSWLDGDGAGDRIQHMLAAGEISASEARLLHDFIANGFVVLPAKLPENMVSAANDAIDDAVASGYQGYQLGSSQRLEQMHVQYPAIRDIWLHSPIHRFLSLVFGAESQPCQTLVYVFGSQQDPHQDTIHLTPFPAGLMCGVWIALEDVQEGAGELAVYPGSHRFPRVYMGDVGASKVRGDWSEFGEKVVGKWRTLIEDSGIEPVPYLARKGDILIWHENLMHAGRPRINMDVSRRSVVTHNFARGAIVFYDSSGNVGHVHDAEA